MIDFNLSSLVFSFSLGLFCSLMPCCLPVIFGYLGYHLKVLKKITKLKAVLKALIFSAGVLTPFTLIGLIFGIGGSWIASLFPWLTFIIALFVIGWGMLLLLRISIPLPSLRIVGKRDPPFFVGVIYGIGTSDCAIMVLVPLLLYSLVFKNIWVTFLNFMLFGFGKSLPIIVGSLLTEKAREEFLKKFKKITYLDTISSILIILAGLWLLISHL